MIEKDPLSYSVLTYAWVFSLSILGGVSGYIRKIKGGLLARFSIVELVGEVVISAFVGVVTFYFCESAGESIPKVFSAGLIGVASHMGSRAIYMMEGGISRIYVRWLGRHQAEKIDNQDQ